MAQRISTLGAMRWAWRILLLFTLGLISTVLVGWARSYAAEGHWGRSGGPVASLYTVRWDAGPDRRHATIHEHHWRGVSYLVFWREDRPHVLAKSVPAEFAIVAWAYPTITQAVNALPLRSNEFPFHPFDQSNAAVAVGWPWKALMCPVELEGTIDLAANPGVDVWRGPGVKRVRAGGLDVPRGVRSADQGSSIIQPRDLRVPLPYTPIWPGLIGNTLVFSAVWAALLALPMLALRWRRSRRAGAGQCPKCRYDLRGLSAGTPCPECGKEHEAARPMRVEGPS